MTNIVSFVDSVKNSILEELKTKCINISEKKQTLNNDIQKAYFDSLNYCNKISYKKDGNDKEKWALDIVTFKYDKQGTDEIFSIAAIHGDSQEPDKKGVPIHKENEAKVINNIINKYIDNNNNVAKHKFYIAGDFNYPEHHPNYNNEFTITSANSSQEENLVPTKYLETNFGNFSFPDIRNDKMFGATQKERVTCLWNGQRSKGSIKDMVLNGDKLGNKYRNHGTDFIGIKVNNVEVRLVYEKTLPNPLYTYPKKLGHFFRANGSPIYYPYFNLTDYIIETRFDKLKFIKIAGKIDPTAEAIEQMKNSAIVMGNAPNPNSGGGKRRLRELKSRFKKNRKQKRNKRKSSKRNISKITKKSKKIIRVYGKKSQRR